MGWRVIEWELCRLWEVIECVESIVFVTVYMILCVCSTHESDVLLFVLRSEGTGWR